MDPDLIRNIAKAPVEIETEFKDEPARFIGHDDQIDGLVTIRARRKNMRAELVCNVSPMDRMITKFQAQGASGGELFVSDFLLRDQNPGKLIAERGYARIESVKGNWAITKCINDGSGDGPGPEETSWRFKVQELVIHGPAQGRDTAAVRTIFEGSDLGGASEIGGKTLLLTALSKDAESPADELLSATTVGTLDEVQDLSLLYTLSFISGNRLNVLLSDYFDEDGELIEIRHQRGAGMSRGRNAPFHRFYGRITATGIEQIADGFTRLMRAGFPIAIIVHHLTEANTNDLDLDGQHLTLAIHAAIEAWNRIFGVDLWIEDERWEKSWFALLRKIFRPVLKPYYKDIGNDVVSNIWVVLRHANRSQTSWRQRQLFAALDIDVSDCDSKRVLAMRDELLHNGYFLKRFGELTAEERQLRLDDIARLRNLAHTIVFRLAGFSGECFDFLAHGKRLITSGQLPDKIATQPN